MLLLTDNLFNNDLIKTLEKIPAIVVESAISQAEKRLDKWFKKGYYERVVQLAKIAEEMPNKNDQRFALINLEINELLAQSSGEIALL